MIKIYKYLSRSSLLRIFTLLMVWMGAIGASEMKGATSAQTLQQCAHKLSSSKSIRADFTMTVSGKRMSGNLLSKGSKFAITLPGIGTWYDGVSMWSYSAQNKETTMWKPTKSELAESNPLLYLSQASDYTVTDGTPSAPNTKTLVLTPKKRNAGIKRILVTINTQSLLPSVIKIESGSGSTLVNIKNLRLNTSIPDASFKYDEKAHKGIPVIKL